MFSSWLQLRWEDIVVLVVWFPSAAPGASVSSANPRSWRCQCRPGHPRCSARLCEGEDWARPCSPRSAENITTFHLKISGSVADLYTVDNTLWVETSFLGIVHRDDDDLHNIITSMTWPGLTNLIYAPGNNLNKILFLDDRQKVPHVLRWDVDHNLLLKTSAAQTCRYQDLVYVTQCWARGLQSVLRAWGLIGVVRVAPGIALVDDEVDVHDMESLAQPLQEVERVGVHTEQEITQSDTARFVLVEIWNILDDNWFWWYNS